MSFDNVCTGYIKKKELKKKQKKPLQQFRTRKHVLTQDI